MPGCRSLTEVISRLVSHGQFLRDVIFTLAFFFSSHDIGDATLNRHCYGESERCLASLFIPKDLCLSFSYIKALLFAILRQSGPAS